MKRHKHKLIWDERYKRGLIYGRDPSHAAKLAVLEGYVKAEDKVAELGGGYGRNSAFFSEMGAHPTLIEISEVALKLAHAHHPAVKTLELDLTALLPAVYHGVYDTVFCNFVLHLLDPHERMAMIENARTLLRDGGRAVWSLVSIEDEEFGKGKRIDRNTFALARDGRAFHFFDRTEIEQLFENGWKLERVKHCDEIEQIVSAVKKTDFWFVVAKKVSA